ncbi:MAG TPA: response regulator [Candidatus Solibacter sp.]|nr:response regulator [Candidatus Solibacter sp.]
MICSSFMEMRPRALIVEDEAVTRSLLRQLLTSSGCEVDEATDGEEAIAKLSAGRYNVILLDIVLPKLSGTHVMDFLREEDPESLERVIVVTGLNVEEIRKLFPTVCHTLGKPVIPTRLLDSVQKCLAANSSSDEVFTRF